MSRAFGRVSGVAALLLALVGCAMVAHASFAQRQAAPQLAYAPAQCGPDPVFDTPPAAPPPPSPVAALRRGVLIVVSIPSQRLFVFKDGAEWGSTTVSTGRRGHGTPAGTFTILQKHVHHRSRTYGNAPMPYMQRLTWGGVALHAGRVTGAPASHGCIRLPWQFAKELYALTNPASTSVVIVRQPLVFADAARSAALGLPAPPAPVRQAWAPPQPAFAQPAQPPRAMPQPVIPKLVPPPPQGMVQTIQLAAATNIAGADNLWQELAATQPELQSLEPVIVPAVVHSVQVYRLRASGRDAHAICSRLAARGIACMKVTA
ncbi:MAG: L,D-transpeptidase family protein [Novosphingobium sp.]|uniref:L,D-transpeptidase family protein n=1 Tax=Novosphingobium sp. TaxID=1874826 RepID=UPI003018BF22